MKDSLSERVIKAVDLVAALGPHNLFLKVAIVDMVLQGQVNPFFLSDLEKVAAQAAAEQASWESKK